MKRVNGKNIYLRKLTELDATNEYCNWLNDPLVNKYLETRKSTIEEIKEYINNKNNDIYCKFFGIFDLNNDIHIGNAKLEPIDFNNKTAIFGILIGNKKYWGKNIGTEATKLMCVYGFNELNLDCIKLGVISVNKKAIRVYEKVGFKIINIEKNKIKHGNTFFDKVNMQIKKTDFKNTIAIIQARTKSIRFPGKMLVRVQEKTIIKHVIDRVKESKFIDGIVLATSEDTSNDILEREVNKIGVNVFRGSEDDVLDRFYHASKKFGATTIVRITGDCPLIDPEIIDKVINFFNINKYDYVSNIDPPTFPDGMDVEVFSFDALEKTWKNAKLKSEREHVTPFIRNNKKLFKIKNFENEKDLSEYRITLDEKEDLIVIEEILNKLDNKKTYNLSDIINVLESNKKILEKNKKYERNEGYKKSLEEDKKIK